MPFQMMYVLLRRIFTNNFLTFGQPVVLLLPAALKQSNDGHSPPDMIMAFKRLLNRDKDKDHVHAEISLTQH